MKIKFGMSIIILFINLASLFAAIQYDNIVQSKPILFKLTGGFQVEKCKQLNNGNYAVYGNIQNEKEQNGISIKVINSSGELVWTQEYFHKKKSINLSAVDLFQSGNGDLVFLVNEYKEKKIKYSKIYVYTLTLDGALKSQNIIDVEEPFECVGIYDYNEKEITLHSYFHTEEYLDKGVYIITIDYSGKIIYRKQLVGSDTTSIIKKYNKKYYYVRNEIFQNRKQLYYISTDTEYHYEKSASLQFPDFILVDFTITDKNVILFGDKESAANISEQNILILGNNGKMLKRVSLSSGLSNLSEKGIFIKNYDKTNFLYAGYNRENPSYIVLGLFDIEGNMTYSKKITFEEAIPSIKSAAVLERENEEKIIYGICNYKNSEHLFIVNIGSVSVDKIKKFKARNSFVALSFPTDEKTKITNVLRLQNSDYLIFGDVYKNNIKGVCLTKTNAEYQIIWKKEYYSDASNELEGVDIFETSNKKIVFIANDYDAKNYSKRGKTYLFQINDKGEAEKHLIDTRKDAYCQKAMLDNSNNIMLYFDMDPGLIKVDVSGKQLDFDKYIHIQGYKDCTLSFGDNHVSFIGKKNETMLHFYESWMSSTATMKEYGSRGYEPVSIFQNTNNDFLVYCMSDKNAKIQSDAILTILGNGTYKKIERISNYSTPQNIIPLPMKKITYNRYLICNFNQENMGVLTRLTDETGKILDSQYIEKTENVFNTDGYLIAEKTMKYNDADVDILLLNYKIPSQNGFGDEVKFASYPDNSNDNLIIKDITQLNNSDYVIRGHKNFFGRLEGYLKLVDNNFVEKLTKKIKPENNLSFQTEKLFEIDGKLIMFGIEFNHKDYKKERESKSPQIIILNKSFDIVSKKNIFTESGYDITEVEKMKDNGFVLCITKYENDKPVNGIAILDPEGNIKNKFFIENVIIDNIKYTDKKNIFIKGLKFKGLASYLYLAKITETGGTLWQNEYKLADSFITCMGHGLFQVDSKTFAAFITANNEKKQEINVIITFDDNGNILERINIPKLDENEKYETTKNVLQLNNYLFMICGYLGDNNTARAFARTVSLEGKNIDVKYSQNKNFTFNHCSALKNQADEIVITGLKDKVKLYPNDIYILNYGNLNFPEFANKTYSSSSILQAIGAKTETSNIALKSKETKVKEVDDKPLYLRDENKKVYEVFLPVGDQMVEINQVMQRKNLNYVALGKILNGPNRAPGIYGILLIELDKNLNLLWKRIFYNEDKYHYEPIKCFENQSDELVVITNRHITKEVKKEMLKCSYVDFLIIENGIIQSKINIKFDGYTTCYNGIKINDNQLLLSLFNYENKDLKKNLIAKTDLSGNITWKKELALGYYEHITPADDGGFFIANYNLDKKNTIATKYNSNGEIEWTKEFDNHDFMREDVIQTESGNYIVFGEEKTFSYSKLALLVFDKNGEIIKYDNSISDYKNKFCVANQIVKLKNNRYMILGATDIKTQEKIFYGVIDDKGGIIYDNIEEKYKYDYSPYCLLIDKNNEAIVSGITNKLDTWDFYTFIRNLGNINEAVTNFQKKSEQRTAGREKYSKSTRDTIKRRPLNTDSVNISEDAEAQSFNINSSDKITGEYIMETKDNNFIILSSMSPYEEHTGIVIMKIDAKGIILKKETIFEDKNTALNPYGIIKSNDEFYYILGNQNISGGNKNISWLYKIDDDCKVISKSKINESNNFYYFSLLKLKNNNFLIGGMDYKNPDNSDIMLSEINQNGNIIWTKTIDLGKGERLSCVQQTADNGFILTGKTGDTKSSKFFDIFVLRLDDKANEKWRKIIGGNENESEEFGKWIIEDAPGSFLLLGSRPEKVTKNGNIFLNSNYDIYLAKFDDNGLILWDKKIGKSGRDDGFYLTKWKDGNYLIVGNYDLNKPFVNVVDEKGTEIFRREFGADENKVTAHSACVTGDGSVLFAGDGESGFMLSKFFGMKTANLDTLIKQAEEKKQNRIAPTTEYKRKERRR